MILEAMKRSKEGEAKTSDVPTVDTVHYVPEPESRFSRWQVGGMLAGVVVVIAGVLTTIWPSEQTSRATASSATYSAAPTISPSPEVGGTITSVSQEVGQQAERPAVQQLKADESLIAAVPPSKSVQESSVEDPVKETPALRANQDPPSAAAPISDPRGGLVAANSTPPNGRVMPQATQPVTSPEELRAIYQALNEEASQTAVTDESSASSDGGESGADNSVSPISQASGEAPPIDFADILAAAQEELGVRPLVESSEPLLETLSQQIKDDIPSLIYSEHRYDPAGSSSVTLNGKTVKERQRVGAFTVIEILPDSVVLRWRETKFRVRARNSWVNM